MVTEVDEMDERVHKRVGLLLQDPYDSATETLFQKWQEIIEKEGLNDLQAQILIVRRFGEDLAEAYEDWRAEE